MAVESQAAGVRPFPRLHWSAVIAGVFLAIACHIVMGLAGAALGLAAEPADSQAVGAAAAIWALITPFVATLLGAWLACRLADTAGDDRSAYVHGILVWCIGLVAGALFLTGTLASGAMAAGTAASGTVGQMQRMPGGEVRTTPRATSPRTDEAARRAGAAAWGLVLSAIAGLLGAVVAAGLGQRRPRGRGFGWRVAIQRRDEAHAGTHGGHLGQERYAGTSQYGPPPTRAPGAPEASPPPTDPYHH
jgi:hypothetical protein